MPCLNYLPLSFLYTHPGERCSLHKSKMHVKNFIWRGCKIVPNVHPINFKSIKRNFMFIMTSDYYFLISYDFNQFSENSTMIP